MMQGQRKFKKKILLQFMPGSKSNQDVLYAYSLEKSTLTITMLQPTPRLMVTLKG